ncbi:MAG: hypothetical protein NZU63_07970 [Gemmataceae bacterium]|nr:hypothetical protein [Gemmataceae bacterium]MDW8242177.1 hypothetical protein [Thermogemmata sp.]
MPQGLIDTLVIMVAGAGLVWLLAGCGSRTPPTVSPPSTPSEVKTPLPPEVETDPASATQHYLSKPQRRP